MLRVIVSLLVLSLCSACRQKSPTTESTPLRVDAISVSETEIQHSMTFIGTISSNYDAVIQPRVSGYLKHRHFASGLPVRRGELLFTIDDEPFTSSLLSAEAQLYSAQAEAVEARNMHERAIPLARINAISQTQLDEYATQLSAAEASLRSAQQQVRRAQIECSYTRIYSPIDGIAASVSAHEGDYVGPSTQFESLTTISNIDTISVDISIPMQQYLLYAQRSTPTFDNSSLLSSIRLTLANGDEYPYEGQYSYTRKDISDKMGAIVLVVNFPNPDYRLKAGQFARIRCSIGAPRRAILIPQSAVSQRQGVDAVWILNDDNSVEFRKVTLGATRDTMWQIEQGLSAGNRVVTSGLQKLRNGMKVEPIITSTLR